MPHTISNHVTRSINTKSICWEHQQRLVIKQTRYHARTLPEACGNGSELDSDNAGVNR